MVIRGILLGLLSLFASAAAALDATVDRQAIYENETVELILEAELAPDRSFSLFDLNALNIEPPDTRALEERFEILDRQQKYNVQIINNVNQSVITWTYTLQPRRAGELEIPALEYEGKRSEPITVTVQPGSDPATAGAEDLRLTLEQDLKTAWVQQQIFLTVKLSFTDDLVQGELDHPDHPDAMVRQLGKQREYEIFQDGRRMRVVERHYALFPRKPGTLQLGPLEFSGMFIQRRLGRRVTRSIQSGAIEIEVKAPPSSFSGDHWVPAQSVLVHQDWEPDVLELELGETLTRQLRIEAAGQEGVVLPEIPVPDIKGLRAYPEKAQTETSDQAAGVTGTRLERQTFVATQPGEFSLPPIEIRWWDTIAGKERSSRVPGRQVRVVGANPVAGSDSVTAGSAEASATDTALPRARDRDSAGGGMDWQVGVLAGGGWAVAAILGWLLWKRRHTYPNSGFGSKGIPPGHAAGQTRSLQLRDLHRALENEPLQLARLFPNWCRQQSQNAAHYPQAWQKLIQETREPLNQIQRLAFGQDISKNPDTEGKGRTLGQQLVSAAEAFRSEAARWEEGQPVLPDAYRF